MVRDAPAHPPPPPREDPYPAEKARGAEIILRTPARRIVFFGGLIGLVALLLVVRLAAG